MRVAQLRSFKAAAASLGLTSSAVSKAISRLEAEVGVGLVQRTTRSVGLTDEGGAFYENCRQVLAEIERAERLLSGVASGPYGRLRVHMTEGLARRVVMPLVGRFLAAYPGLSVSAELSDRAVDMANEGFDVDIRIGEVADSRVVARKLGHVRFVMCASPGYLAAHGTPRKPADLDRHNCLSYARMHTGRQREWWFQEDGRLYSKAVSGTLQANNSEALLVAAVAGLGIANVSAFIARESIAAGAVVPLLSRYAAPGPAVHAVHLQSHNLAPKVRTFVEFLAEHIDLDRTG